jgi:hypothetical protein
MSDASVFREPSVQETAEPLKAGSGAVEAPVITQPGLLASYETDQGKPYPADYFELGNVWEREPALARDIREINGYIQEQLKQGKLDNSTKAASNFIKEMERKAGLSRYESTTNRISKILAYIDFQKVVHG